MGGGGGSGGGGSGGGGSSGSGGGLTEKLALQMALQNASTGTVGFMGAGSRGAQQSYGNKPYGANNAMTRGPGVPPVGPTHHNFRTKPCRYFMAGMCKNGDRCTFLHTKDGQAQGQMQHGGPPQRGMGGHMNSNSASAGFEPYRV